MRAVGGAQNGIFCRVGCLLATAWRTSAARNCDAWSRWVRLRPAGPSADLGRARTLTPLRPAAAAGEVRPAAPGETPPFDPARSERDRPWFDEINERRFALAARGVLDPDGAQMFPSDPEAARAWDSIAVYGIPAGDRVWVIADLRRRAAARNAGPEANSHGA